MFNKLAQDEQDSVRLLTVTDLVAIAEELSPEESKAYFLQTLKSMVADKSWRVRYMIADNFVKASAWDSCGLDIAAFFIIHEQAEAHGD